MPNSIALFDGYSTLLDEAYAQASVTAVLDGSPELIRQGANVNELILPKLSLQGLSDYSRLTGYAPGDVSLTHETVVCGYDRGRLFTVDERDNAETAGVAFGALAGEFLRVKVAPELDAYRLAKYAAEAGGLVYGDLEDGAQVLLALRAAATALDNAECPMENRYLFITPALMGMVEDLDTTHSRAVLSRFMPPLLVAPGRFQTAVTLLTGDAGGYAPAPDAAPLNFLVVQKDAVAQFTKHTEVKVITPALNQTADAWKFGYRLVGVAQVRDNKAGGVYAHAALAA